MKTLLVRMSKEIHPVTKKTASTMAIYRTLIKSLFSEDVLAKSNGNTMKENHPILSACKGL